MNPQHTPDRRPTLNRPGWRRLGASLAAAAAIGGAALACAPAASAHDSMVDSTPEDGAELTTAPTEATLQYSADLNKLGTVALLKDANGRQFEADPSVSGDTLTVDFGDPLPEGDYTLTVRVVSSDGHPVDQTLDFSVDVPDSASPTPAATAPSSSPAALDTPQPTVEASEAPAVDTPDSGALPPAAVWTIAGVAVLAAAAVVVAKVRRQTR